MGIKSNKAEPIKTILTIVLVCLGIFLFKKVNWVLIVALVIGIGGLFSTIIAVKIDWFWMKLAWLLSKTIPYILMTFVYYIILTPVALLARLFGAKDPLLLKNTKESTFKSCNKTFEKSSFEKPW
jgi:hypothetical protein